VLKAQNYHNALSILKNNNGWIKAGAFGFYGATFCRLVKDGLAEKRISPIKGDYANEYRLKK
jgi:hypothetical protein